MSEETFENIIEELKINVSPDLIPLIETLGEKYEKQTKRLNNILNQREKLKEDVNNLKNEIDTLRLSATNSDAIDSNLFSNIKALIAEDEESNRMILQEQFNQIGLREFKIVDDGQQALEILKKDSDIDVLFTDWQMPNLDGVELAKTLRARNNQMPIIMFTANRSEEKIDFALTQGIDIVISKPVKLQEVKAVLKETFDGEQNQYINFKALEEIIGTSNSETIKTLLNSFKVSSNDSIKELETALVNEDYQTMKGVCHRLEGASASAGAELLRISTESLHQLLIIEASSIEIQVAFDDLASIKFHTDKVIDEFH